MLQEQRLSPHDSRHNSQADHTYSRTSRYVRKRIRQRRPGRVPYAGKSSHRVLGMQLSWRS
jgi:hypothetical protein